MVKLCSRFINVHLTIIADNLNGNTFLEDFSKVDVTPDNS